MKLSSFTFAIFAAALATATLPSHADGLYVGGSLGLPHYQDSVDGIEGNNSGVAAKLFGGWQFTPNVAVEGGVTELGRVRSDAGSVKGHGEYLDAVGLLPLNASWSLLGSVGVAHVDLDTTSGDDSSAALKLGVGAEYAISPNVALRGEYENYRADVFGTHSNVGQFNLGVRVSF
jgi:OOP family OmpA-OmpF porin